MASIAKLTNTEPQFEKALHAYPKFIDAQIGIYNQRKKSLNEKLKALEDSLNMARAELHMNGKLKKTGDVSDLDLLKARRQVTEIQARYFATKNKYLEDMRSEVAKLEDDLAAYQTKLTERESILAHTDITAPMEALSKV
ncbi:MAG: hypothetical protein EXR35_07060 [Limnohabitans sp.]|nr:hypothetical protein [Limnohabitans sp.]